MVILVNQLQGLGKYKLQLHQRSHLRHLLRKVVFALTLWRLCHVLVKREQQLVKQLLLAGLVVAVCLHAVAAAQGTLNHACHRGLHAR